MIPLPAAEETLVRRLLGAWLSEVLGVQRVTGGATNRVYRVETARDLAFLRVYKRADRALAEREHALIAHVRAQGLPAMPPRPLRSGSTVLELDGAVCALYEPAPGQQLSGSQLTAEQASAAGALLGRLHRALAPLRDAGYLQWKLDWDGPAWIERLNVVERALLTRSAGSPAGDETDRWALERLRAQRSWLAQPECRHSYQPRAAAQVVHGDYQDANLFFAGERVSAVIDWEQGAFMPRAYELARAAWFMFRLAARPTGHFLQAYADEYPLTSAELEDGARAWGCFADHHVWPLEEVYLNGNDAARRYIPHAPFRPFEHAWAELRAARPLISEANQLTLG